MEDLRDYFGDIIYPKPDDSERNKKIDLAVSISLDALVSWLIVLTFGITWEYAFIKVFLAFQLASILKGLGSGFVHGVWFRFWGRENIKKEMAHYIALYGPHVDLPNIKTYEDFLIKATISTSTPEKLRTLAAMQYANLIVQYEKARTLNPDLMDVAFLDALKDKSVLHVH